MLVNLWWVMEKKGIHIKYIHVIKGMYEGAVTSVKTVEGDMKEFSITMGLHQGRH